MFFKMYLEKKMRKIKQRERDCDGEGDIEINK
jgi:hypothetical protein